MDVALGDLLGDPHDAGGVNRLVRGNHDEVRHAVLVGQIHQAFCAEHVVVDGLADIGFHQGNVFMCGGVEDDFRAVFLVYLLHPPPIGDVGDARIESGGHSQLPQLPLNGEDAILAASDEDKGLRIVLGDLAADLGSDAASGASDHHPPSFQQLADVLGVEGHRIASQEVVDFDAAQRDAVVAFQPVHQRTNDLQVQFAVLASLHEFAQPAAGQRAGNYQHVGGAIDFGDLVDIFQLAENGNLAQPHTLAYFIGGQQAADPVGQMELRLNLMGKNAVGEIRSHQQRPSAVLAAEHGLQYLAKHPPTCPHGPQD